MTRLVTDSSDVFCGDGEIEKLGKNSQQNAFIAQKKKKEKQFMVKNAVWYTVKAFSLGIN